MDEKTKKIREQLCVCVWHWKGGLCARRSVVWERRHDEPLTHDTLPVFSIHPLILHMQQNTSRSLPLVTTLQQLRDLLLSFV